MTAGISAGSMSVLGRFWLGSVVPSLALIVVLGVLLATGGDAREAPIIVFFVSLLAAPAIVLLNCWVLFVNWQRRTSLAAAGSVVPAVYLLGCTLFIHGTGPWQKLGVFALTPLMAFPMKGLGTLAALWALAIFVILFMARYIAARRQLATELHASNQHVNEA